MVKYAPETFALRNEVPLVLRHLGPEHVDQYILLRSQVAEETDQACLYKLRDYNENRVKQDLLESLQSQHELIVGAFDDEVIVGCVHVKVCFPEHPWMKHIGAFGMAILNEYSSQGLGTKFMDVIDVFSKKHGISKLEATVRVNNAHGLNLYKKEGFVVEGTRKSAALIDGEYFDEYYIGKIV